jgi:hypothetical protein
VAEMLPKVGTTTDLNVSIDGEGDVDTSGLTTT